MKIDKNSQGSVKETHTAQYVFLPVNNKSK